MSTSTIEEYLDDVQYDAVRVSSVIQGVELLNAEGTREATNAAYVITQIALKMSSDLVNKLEYSARPAAKEERT